MHKLEITIDFDWNISNSTSLFLKLALMFSQWKWSVSKFFKLQSIFTSWKAQVSMTNKVITFIEQGREEEEEEEERERERERARGMKIVDILNALCSSFLCYQIDDEHTLSLVIIIALLCYSYCNCYHRNATLFGLVSFVSNYPLKFVFNHWKPTDSCID